MRSRRRRWIVPTLAVVIVILLATSALVALAYWSAPGAGSSSAASGSLDAAVIGVPPSASNAVTVTWTQQASLQPAWGDNSPISYSVERKLDSGSWAAVASGGCSGAKPHGVANCVDAPPADGSYSYRVVATYHSWRATSSEAGPISFTIDASAPSGGSVDASGLVGDGGRYSTSTALSIVLDKGTDSSGMASSGAQLRRSTATLTSGGTCGTYNASVQIGANDPVSPVAHTVPAGEACYRYEYVVADIFGNSTTYTSPDIKVDTITPASPTATALTNGGGTGSAYVNTTNKASVDFSVTLPTSSSNANTITLNIADAGSAHALAPTADATTGAGTAAFDAQALTAFDDGAITVSATAADLAGNRSAATTITRTKDTVAPASPTATALTNGGGTGHAYINAANKAGVDFSVTLPAGSSSTDTITLSIADTGSAHTLAPTAAATTGAGTTTFNAQALTAFNDGTITIDATAADLAGNRSAATTITPTKDTVAPASPTTTALTNGGGTGSAYINAANKASVNFSVTLPAGSVNTDTITLSIADAGSAHTLAPTAAATTGAGTATFNAQALTAFTDGTITIGATAADVAGNASAATTITPTKDTVAPANPGSLTLTNGGGAGSAYINATNKASVSYSVVNAADVSGDTITVTLTSNGGGGSAVGSAVRGASSPTAVSVNASSSPPDGTVTATAKASDAAGNDSAGTVTTTGPKDTVAPAAPTATALTNGGGVGSAYINAANKASVNFSVTLPAGSVNTNTVTLAIADAGSAHTQAPTAAATAGAGTVTFNGRVLTSFADGTITVSATAADVAGNASAATTITPTKDTVAPSAADIQTQNVSIAGAPFIGDKTFYTFSEPMNPASLKAGWNGSSLVIGATLTKNTSIKDTLALGSGNFGAVATPGGYTSSTASWSGSTIVMSGSVVTLTFANAAGSASWGNSGNLIWTPSTSATDLAGNALAATQRIQTGAATAAW